MTNSIKFCMILACMGLCCIVLIITSPNKETKLTQSIDTNIHFQEPIYTPKIIELSSKIQNKEEIEDFPLPISIPPPPPPIKKKPKSFYMWVTATAYCPCARCCGRGSPGITKTGRSAWTPGVAVYRPEIPLGSHIDIPGYTRVKNGAWVLCDDIGGKIRSRMIDVRFNYHWQAKQWGRKYIKIKVYPK